MRHTNRHTCHRPYHTRCLPLTLLLIAAFLPMTCLAGNPDHEPADTASSTARYVHQLTAVYKPGLILHTNEFLRGNNPEARTMNHATGYHLKYAFSAPEGSREARIYRDAYQGIGIGFNSFNPQLSNPVSAYVFQGARIMSLSDRIALNYEWNLGLAFGWNPYDELQNPDNKVIGSRVTAYIGLDLYLRWVASRHADVSLGLGVAHFSNGNTQFPNLGLNTAALYIGSTYYINRRSRRLSYRHEALPPSDHNTVYDLILFGAWRQRGMYDGGVAYTLPGKDLVAGFSFSPLFRLNHWLMIGGAVDGLYDRSANLIVQPASSEYYYTRPSSSRQMALGLSSHIEFTMPYFAINFGVGTNVVNGKGDFSGVYQTLALKANLTRRLLLHIGYSLNDFHKPRNLMLGMGWRFGRLTGK